MMIERGQLTPNEAPTKTTNPFIALTALGYNVELAEGQIPGLFDITLPDGKKLTDVTCNHLMAIWSDANQ